MNDQAPSARPPRISALATACLIFGVLGVLCALPVVGPIMAFALGTLALARIGLSENRIIGQGRAIAGMILGILGLATNYFMFSLALQAKHQGSAARCVSNVHQIGLAISTYADVHNGTIPRDFGDLRLYLPNLDKLLICPAATDTNRYSYELVNVTNRWDVSPKLIILREIEPRHHGARTVLFADGHVEQIPADH